MSPSGQRRESDRYQDAQPFDGLPYAPDPLEGSTPMAELADRPAAEARHALGRIARGRVPGTIVQDLLIGVTEAVINAQRHGRPPATVRIWADGDRVVVTVHDTGPGPADRLAGLVPMTSSTPDRHLGLGLWVTHQLDIDVTLRYAGDGFTVRLRHPPGSPGAGLHRGVTRVGQPPVASLIICECHEAGVGLAVAERGQFMSGCRNSPAQQKAVHLRHPSRTGLRP